MNKNTNVKNNLYDTNKADKYFLEMINEYNKETIRINKENEVLKIKEKDEFIKMVYQSGIPVYSDNKITILDKKTNTIIDISNTTFNE
jgi:DNA-directed RNA polymerase